MAGIPEEKAEAAKRQGEGLAKHLGVAPGTDRYRRILYGTKIKAGWRASNWKTFHGRPIHHSKGGVMGGKSMKPGGGGRFAALRTKLARKPGIRSPGGLAAKIGRQEYGKEKFQEMAAAGRHRAAAKRHGPLSTALMKKAAAARKSY